MQRLRELQALLGSSRFAKAILSELNRPKKKQYQTVRGNLRFMSELLAEAQTRDIRNELKML